MARRDAAGVKGEPVIGSIAMTMPVDQPTAPVVVGGVGGSGTGLVAEILRMLRFDTGHNLNRPLDDRWFALLFRQPRVPELAPR
jgi:hypothetical protein